MNSVVREHCDQEAINQNQMLIACDEVGRGPIAGPVVACAISCEHKCGALLLKHLKELGLNDSKKLSASKRAKILNTLTINVNNLSTQVVYSHPLGFKYCLQEMTSVQIDKLNILQASLKAMQFCCELLQNDHIALTLIDGNQLFRDSYLMPMRAIIGGDGKSLCIALASVIAKEFRDWKMCLYDREYPQYGLAKHAGYPTKAHKEALAKYGYSPLHRLSFKGVKEYGPISTRT